MTDAPERIWAQRGTLIGDPAENGYWEARNLYSHSMAEYVRADIHAAAIARAERAETELAERERDALAAQLPYALSQAERDVLDERRGQVTREGFFPATDDHLVNGELSRAGACYVLFSQTPTAYAPLLWPWEARWWKPGPARRMLVKAAALILAEIERLDRAEARKGGAQ